FVDVETTGTSAFYNRIIEIGILKTIDGKVVKEYKTLINPQTRIDPFIENLTGIAQAALENAPTFEDIAQEIYELLTDSYFVAHNVRFDYGFLRNEFKRIGGKLNLKHFCTVKLSRLLYPDMKRHNLDAIIEKFDIECKNRHRAFDDAKVLFEFFKKSQKLIDPEVFEKAVNIALKRPSVPLNITEDVLDSLPESPGVYVFYGKDNSILYIGKSVNIHDRVLSHFSNDYISSTDMKIAKEIEQIETFKTTGELGALLLESTMIKTHQPFFNRRLRASRKMTILIKQTDKNGYHTTETREIEKIDISDIDNIIGVFKSRKQLKDFLYILSKDYHLCPKLLNLEKTKDACFSYQLGQCYGACKNAESNLKYNLRFDEAFYKHKIRPWKFDGPIIIKEVNDAKDGFVIDKWCLLGKVNADSDLESISSEYIFDLDTYKILSRFISKKENDKKLTRMINKL
ncbi:MAG TPA: exonuclease domain-containing protein, partial [Candidatus Saccharimonadales bacterium]|nr:exonuclease domain-containing protein [Candidatus Saccharimonadales bacterium]